MKPDLVVLHNGGGVQTGTICEMIHDGLVEKPQAVIQADTGDEPSYIYKQWERDKMLMKAVNVPYLVVSNGNLHDDIYGGGRFAAMPLFTIRKNGKRGKKQKIADGQMGMFELSDFEEEIEQIENFGLTTQIEYKGKMRRQCTREYKIVPIEREIRTMLLEMGLAKETNHKPPQIRINPGTIVESWIGYTTDEIERVNRLYQAKWQRFRFPLIEMRMSKADCLQWLKDNNKPPRLSSACKKCPLIGNKQRRQIRDNDPDGWQETLQFDDDLRSGKLRIVATAKGDLYLSNQFIPLRDVNIDDDSNQSSFLCSQVGCMT